MTRLRIPFDSWAMQVDVPVSQLVREGPLAWSCGQCPLDTAARVRNPGDLTAQAEVVCDYAEALLRRARLAADDVGKLVVYHLAGTPAEREDMLSTLRRRLGDGPLIVPVAVPHFYYEGMRIEVDVFASTAAKRLPGGVDAATGARLEIVDGGEILWAALELPAAAAAAPLPAFVLPLLHSLGATPETLLDDRWFAPGEESDAALASLARAGLVTDPALCVRVPRAGAPALAGELTFVRGAAETHPGVAAPGGVVVHRRRADRLVRVCGSCADGDAGVVGQTRAIMPAIAASLAEAGLGFEHVVKVTAHYAGGPTAADLHENMQVRHAFHARPGPASTGVPVRAFRDAARRIVVDFLAVAPA